MSSSLEADAEAPAPAMPVAGDKLGDRFAVTGLACHGGMGSIYQGIELGSGSKVAIKFIGSTSSSARARFQRESRILANLSHPSVVQYLAHGTTSSGLLYLVMEWLEGEDLSARLSRERRLSQEDCLSLVRRVGEGLAEAHSRGIVHRDIKQLYLLFRGVGAAAVPHPLLPTFHSATPYLLGDDYVVKYSAELAHREQVSGFKVGRDGGFLRRALRNGLDGQPIELHLFLHAVSKTEWPLETIVNAVEDATTDFSTLNALKVHVATIRFEKQDPATSANMREAERRSFNPWNSLKVHRPIGSINRGRLFIYKDSAHLRAEAAMPHLHPVASSETQPELPGSQAAE